MLYVKKFIFNPIQENTYIVYDETHEAVIIDCGCFFEREWMAMKEFMEQEGLHPVRLLNTHLHFDHSYGNQFVIRDYHLRPQASMLDYDLYCGMQAQVAMFLGNQIASQINTDFTAQLDTPLNDCDQVSFGKHLFRVISVPGHTPGGICFYCEEENMLFVGDSLFCGSIGRTDLPGGNYHDLVSSLSRKIMTLPPATKVYSGHGPETTIEYENKYNPYL